MCARERDSVRDEKVTRRERETGRGRGRERGLDSEWRQERGGKGEGHGQGGRRSERGLESKREEEQESKRKGWSTDNKMERTRQGESLRDSEAEEKNSKLGMREDNKRN
jgi:hypothetical protein